MRFDQVLFVGEAEHPEFQEAWNWLRACSGVLHAVRFPSEAARWMGQSEFSPRLVVVAQSRPGQFRQFEVESLHRSAPLARLVALLGSWCEGETCSGEPWTGVLRLYWHEFVARVQREAEGVSAWTTAWSLPRTATEAERVDACCRPLVRRQGLIAIAAARHDFYDGVADGCSQAGYSTTWISPDRDSDVTVVSAAIWDDSCLQSTRPLSLSRFVRQVAPAPTTALLHFPRRSEWLLALHDGASGALSKPFSIDDLLSTIAHGLEVLQHGSSPAHAA